MRFCQTVKLIFSCKLGEFSEGFEFPRIGLEPLQGLEVEPVGLPDLVAEGGGGLHDLQVEVDVVTYRLS